MKITIHRGSKEIGGTCIRISSSATSILLDVGLPLSAHSTELALEDLKADAVVISHSHQDHCGLLDVLPAETPVYIGHVGRSLLEATRIFLNHPPLRNQFNYFSSWKPFKIGDIKVTPYLVDHSAPDAYGLLVEADNRKIFYSGDFRAHGRKSVLFDSMVSRPIKDIDVLMMEGTMMQRDNSEFPTERRVEDAIVKTIRSQTNISFLISSSQNIDRIVSAYRACLQTGKMLVIDIYSAWVLDQLRIVSDGVPIIGRKGLKVAFDKRKADILMNMGNKDLFGAFIDRAIRNRVKGAELRSNPGQYLMLLKITGGRYIRSFAQDDNPVNVIYSQWLGYLNHVDGESQHISIMRGIREGNEPGVAFTYAHTSGHATVADLQRFAEALNAKSLIPIHTEHGNRYNEYFENVVSLGDGEQFDL